MVTIATSSAICEKGNNSWLRKGGKKDSKDKKQGTRGEMQSILQEGGTGMA